MLLLLLLIRVVTVMATLLTGSAGRGDDGLGLVVQGVLAFVNVLGSDLVSLFLGLLKLKNCFDFAII